MRLPAALSSKSTRLISKAIFLLLACVFLLPLYGSEAGGPCVPELSFSPDVVTAEGTGQISISVANTGTGICSRAFLSLYYPEGLQYVDASEAAEAGDYFWIFDSVGPGEHKAMNLTVRRTGTGEVLHLDGTVNAGGQDDEETVEIDFSAPKGQAESDSTTSSGSLLCDPREEKGMWVWNTPRGMSDAWRTTVLDTMSAHGFNTAYIDGSELWVLDTATEPQRTNDLADFNNGLQAFVAAARSRNIGVEVTFGYRDWGEPDNRWKPLMIVDKVLEYNASVSKEDKVCGVQSDIEPYLMGDAYENNKALVLGNYLETMDQMTNKVAASGSGSSVEIVIPHFYDPVQAWTPAITFNGVTQSAYEHVLDILSQVRHGSVSIMAYRNFLDGENGITQLVTPELRIAKDRSSSTRVIIAQEVGCGLDPEWVSWCGQTKTTLEGAFSFLRLLFGTNPAFGGFAVNYIDPYIDLTD